MNKRKLIEGPSCLTRAADNEPLFVLRANDELASNTVRRWAHDYLISKGGPTLATSDQLGKYNDAIAVARDMEEYKSSRPVPDNRRFNAPNTITLLKPKRQL